MVKNSWKRTKAMGCLIILCISLIQMTSATILQKDSERLLFDEIWWPMFRNGPSNAGYTQSKAPATNDRWHIYESDKPIKYSSPAIVDNRLYIGTTGAAESYLLCFDVDTGELLWNVDVPGAIESSPAVADGKVFFTFTRPNGQEAFLVSLDAISGEKIWDEQIDNYAFYSPIIFFSKIYVCSIYESDWPGTVHRGRVYCFDLNGNKEWSQQMDIGWVAPWYSALAAGFTMSGKYLFVLSVQESDHHAVLYVIDAETGSFLGDTPLQYFSDVVAPSPVISGSNVYITRMDDIGRTFVHRLDFGGNVEWTRLLASGETMYTASPAIDGVQLYVIAQDTTHDTSHVYCLAGGTGSIVWDNTYNHLAYSCPAVADGKLYFTIGRDVYCVNTATGDTIWTFNTLDEIYSSPAIASRLLFVASFSGDIFAFGNLPRIGEITGGFLKGKTEISNQGITNLTDLTWEMTAAGGFLWLINRTSTGTIDVLTTNMTIPIQVTPIFGLGKLRIEAFVTGSGIGTVSRTRYGFILGPFVIFK